MTDHSEDDAFHARCYQDTLIGLSRGEVPFPPGTTRWRITYLCNHCCHMHSVTGTQQQVATTVSCFMVLGYPIFRIEDEGFAQIASLDGHDLNTQEGLQKAAEAYQEFCSATRG